MNKIEEYFFQGFLYPHEEIDLIIHRHSWALFKPLVKVGLFGLLIPLILMWVFSGDYIFYICALWLLVGCGFLVYEIIDWYYDAILLTNMNILDIEWKGLFHKTANRINYDSIESVSYKIEGAIATLFQFGDLHIHTISEGDKGLTYTENVREVQKTILNKKEEIVAGKSENDTEALKKAMKAIIAEEMGKDDFLEAAPEPIAESENREKPIIILETKEIKDKKKKNN